ncbi:hypothetical protein ACQZV8_13580 [Magnetococcales bacterium HHB-1]
MSQLIVTTLKEKQLQIMDILEDIQMVGLHTHESNQLIQHLEKSVSNYLEYSEKTVYPLLKRMACFNEEISRLFRAWNRWEISLSMVVASFLDRFSKKQSKRDAYRASLEQHFQEMAVQVRDRFLQEENELFPKCVCF